MKRILNKNRKSKLTDKDIELIINTRFLNSYRNTKLYIKKKLKELDQKFSFSVYSFVKEDFIEQYYLNIDKEDQLILDFSLLPNIIKSKTEKIKIICKNKIGSITIGIVETTFKDLIEDKKFPIRAIKKYIAFIPQTTKDYRQQKQKELIRYLEERYGKEYFDFSEVEYLRSDIPIKIRLVKNNTVFWDRPSHLLNKNYFYKEQTQNKSLYTTEEFINLAKNKWGDSCDYSLVEYRGMNNNVTIKCNICGAVFSQRASTHLCSLFPCPECAKREVGKKISHTKEEFISLVEEIYGKNRFDFSQFDYITLLVPGKLIDLSNNKEYLLSPVEILSRNFMKEKGRLGERLVKKALKDLGLSEFFEQEVTIPFVEGRHMGSNIRVDFVGKINNTNFWIEYNGRQHYKLVKFFHTEKDYLEQLTRDKNQRNFCSIKNNQTILIEIPYTYTDLTEITNILREIIINKKDPMCVINIPPIQFLETAL